MKTASQASCSDFAGLLSWARVKGTNSPKIQPVWYPMIQYFRSLISMPKAMSVSLGFLYGLFFAGAAIAQNLERHPIHALAMPLADHYAALIALDQQMADLFSRLNRETGKATWVGVRHGLSTHNVILYQYLKNYGLTLATEAHKPGEAFSLEARIIKRTSNLDEFADEQFHYPADTKSTGGH